MKHQHTSFFSSVSSVLASASDSAAAEAAGAEDWGFSLLKAEVSLVNMFTFSFSSFFPSSFSFSSSFFSPPSASALASASSFFSSSLVSSFFSSSFTSSTGGSG